MPSTRLLSLGALCVNYTALTILMHISRTRADPSIPRYKASSAVVLTEVGKLLVSLYLGLAEVKHADNRVRWDRENHISPSTVLHGLGFGQVETSSERKPNESPRATLRASGTGRSSSPVHTREKEATRRRSSVDAGEVGRARDEATQSLLSPSTMASEEVSDSFVYRIQRLAQEVFAGDWWKLGLPAGLFTLQSNLQYTAVANLSVPAFQVTSQLKILTTALCSVLLLKRTLNSMQWGSLGLLALGVAAVQLQSDKERAGGSSSTLARPDGRPQMNHLLGLAAVLLSCLSSGFASTYFELQLKRVKAAGTPTQTSTSSIASTLEPKDSTTPRTPSPPSVAPSAPSAAPKTGLWVRNVQLSLFGLSIALVGYVIETNKEAWAMFANTGPADAPSGTSWWANLPPLQSIGSLSSAFFVGFTPLVWLVVVLQILGGLLAALVIKYADNIAKNFSTSFSILLSFAASMILFDFHLGLGAVVGALLVLGSTWLFNSTAADRSRAAEAVKGVALSPLLGRRDATSTPVTNASGGLNGGPVPYGGSKSPRPNGTPSLLPSAGRA